MTRSSRLLIVLVLNLALVVGLIAVGISAHSLGVLAAGVDYLADAAAIGVALLAIRMTRQSRGHSRANAVAALVNGGWLAVLSILIIASATDRLISGTPAVHGLPVLVASSIAAVVMAVAALILRGDDDGDSDEALSLRAVLLDTAADAAAAAGVAISGAIIFVTRRFDWLDPAVALVIAVVIGYHTLRLLNSVLTAVRRSPEIPS
ncbi:MAG: cation diffusion facilitator family transporter [Acidimicrobiales bacterium]